MTNRNELTSIACPRLTSSSQALLRSFWGRRCKDGLWHLLPQLPGFGDDIPRVTNSPDGPQHHGRPAARSHSSGVPGGQPPPQQHGEHEVQVGEGSLMKGLSLGTGPETLSSEHFVNASCKTFSNATCFRNPIAPAAAAASQGERHAGAFGPWTVNITNVQQRVHVVAESPVASPPNNMANMKCRLGKVARRRGLLGFSPNPQLSAFHLHVSAASEYHAQLPQWHRSCT